MYWGHSVGDYKDTWRIELTLSWKLSHLACSIINKQESSRASCICSQWGLKQQLVSILPLCHCCLKEPLKDFEMLPLARSDHTHTHCQDHNGGHENWAKCVHILWSSDAYLLNGKLRVKRSELHWIEGQEKPPPVSERSWIRCGNIRKYVVWASEAELLVSSHQHVCVWMSWGRCLGRSPVFPS